MPKKKAAAAENPPADAPKKKRRITKVAKARAAARRANPAANPPMLTDLTHTVLPGFGAYVGTRGLARIVQKVVAKRFPKLAKHAPAISGAATFGGIWLLAHRIQRLAPYHDALVMGSAIAAAHNVLQAYLPPRLTWLFSDAPATPALKPLPAAPATVAAPARASASVPEVEDYDDALEAQLAQLENQASQPAEPSAAPPVIDDLDLSDLGIFAN